MRRGSPPRRPAAPEKMTAPKKWRDHRPRYLFHCEGCGTERVGGYAFDAPNWQQAGHSVHGSRYNKWATAWFCPRCKLDDRITCGRERLHDADREKAREELYGPPRRRLYKN